MGTRCPNCSADAVEYDSEAGAAACSQCGFTVSADHELCSEVERNAEGQQYGGFVSATGRVAGGSRRGNRLPGAVIEQVLPDRARKEVENQANRLGLQKPVVAEATTILEHVYAKLVTSGSHHLDVMAAASVYVAVRMNKHPFSLLEIVTRTGRPLHKVGSAYTSALEVLGYTPPPVDYFRFIQRHSQGLLQPMQKYSKQIQGSFAKLMEWSLDNKAVLAGNTPSLAAAALQLVAMVHQVKLTTEAVAEVLGAQPSTVKKHVLEIKDALVAAAQKYVVWLKNINRNTVLASLEFIVQCTTRIYQDAQPGTAQARGTDQNLPSDSAGQLAASPTVTAQSGTFTLTEHNQKPDSPETAAPIRKRQRDDACAAEVVKKAAVENASAVRVSAYKRASLVVTDLDSQELAEEEAIKPHELGQNLHVSRRHCNYGIRAA